MPRAFLVRKRPVSRPPWKGEDADETTTKITRKEEDAEVRKTVTRKEEDAEVRKTVTRREEDAEVRKTLTGKEEDVQQQDSDSASKDKPLELFSGLYRRNIQG